MHAQEKLCKVMCFVVEVLCVEVEVTLHEVSTLGEKFSMSVLDLMFCCHAVLRCWNEVESMRSADYISACELVEWHWVKAELPGDAAERWPSDDAAV